ncbi:MAG: hypothetical protein KKA60_10200 [Proteobacteria bacterium]|nr:hypothetical protein [Pseudomonadota bacterium]
MKKQSSQKKKSRRARLSPSAMVSIGMGAALVGAGLYGAWFRDSPGGYFLSGLGLLFFVLMWFSYQR